MTTIEKALGFASPDNKAKIVDLSYKEQHAEEWDKERIESQVVRVANYLSQLVQLLPEQRRQSPIISYSFHNSIDQVILFLAICRINCTALPLNFSYTENEYIFYLSDVNTSILIEYESPYVQTDIIAKAADHMNASDRKSDPILKAKLTFDSTSGNYIISHCNSPLSLESTPKVHEAQAHTQCLILHTSGTTSRPKAVPLTQHNLATNIKNIRNTYCLNSKDKSILVMPLFHIHGIMCGVYSPLSAGATIIIPKGGKFSASTFWKDALDYNITWMTTVPTILHILLLRAKEDFEPIAQSIHLRFIRSSSSSLPVDVLEKVESTFHTKVLEAYSMTEASHQMTSNPWKRKPGTVGLPVSIELAILDPAGKKLGPGEVGEVCIKGENVTKGYLNNPQANEEAFRYGYFHTGDLGQVDNEGYLTLCGRIKELINRGGEKIFPAEVDEILLKHPGILEAATFPGPDEKYGESVCCAVVLKEESQQITQQDVQKHVQQFLSAFKVPAHVFITPSLPRTATGKVQRKHLTKYFFPS